MSKKDEERTYAHYFLGVTILLIILAAWGIVCPPWGNTFVKEEIDLLVAHIRNRRTEVSQ